jgi:hypothetical protein
MSAFEREIMEKFGQLPPAAKQRLQALIAQAITEDAGQHEVAAFDYDDWVRNMEMLRQAIMTSHEGKMPPMDVVGTLRDLRDGEDE